jgi:putative membrane protein
MMGYGLMGFGWILGIVLIAGIVWFIVYAAKTKTSGGPGRKGEAIEILKERFARGEIGQEEYEEKRKILSQ